MSDGNPERRAELYFRGSVPAAARDPQSSLVERLERLDADGQLAAFDATAWPKRVPRDGDGQVLDRYEAFREWARAAGVELAPFFETRECYSWSTGESHEALVLPLACLAVYEGDELAAVYPHAGEHGVATVEDGIATLAVGPSVAPDDEEQRPAEAAD